MIGLDRLEAAFEPYRDSMGSLEFASHMAGFDPAALATFAHDATHDLAAVKTNRAGRHALLAGVLMCGVLIGAAVRRQEASA